MPGGTAEPVSADGGSIEQRLIAQRDRVGPDLVMSCRDHARQRTLSRMSASTPLSVRPPCAFVMVVLTTVLAISEPARAQAPAPPDPARATISTERLVRLDAFIQRHVDERRIAGGVVLIAQYGRIVHLKSFGQLDVERNVPMQDAALFRIASMTKAITSVAVMQLVEEGTLLLSTAIRNYGDVFCALRRPAAPSRRWRRAEPTPDANPLV